MEEQRCIGTDRRPTWGNYILLRLKLLHHNAHASHWSLHGSLVVAQPRQESMGAALYPKPGQSLRRNSNGVKRQCVTSMSRFASSQSLCVLRQCSDRFGKPSYDGCAAQIGKAIAPSRTGIHTPRRRCKSGQSQDQNGIAQSENPSRMHTACAPRERLRACENHWQLRCQCARRGR